MPLTTVFFPRPNTNLGYAKAIVDVNAVDFFIDMGFHHTPETFLKPEIPKPDFEKVEDQPKPHPVSAKNPDAGWGPPGSMEFHTQTVMGAETMDEIVNYTFEVTGRRIAKRGEMEDVQRNALKRLREYTDG
jgi:hypothetical protein